MGYQNSDLYCIVYAIITEAAAGVSKQLCRGAQPQRHVYTTTTNSVEIGINTMEGELENSNYFILKYEGIHTHYLTKF